MTRIGIIGVGRMGLPIAHRLDLAGHRVAVHDLRSERADAARALGLAWAPDPATAAADWDVVLTVLPSADEVAAALTDGLLDALPAGAVWVDHSSCAPDAAAPLRQQATARGLDVLEAPLGGGPEDAASGTLRVFAAGEDELVDRMLPLLHGYAAPERVVRTGGPGTGYTVKLLVNQLWFGQAVATAEALLLGSRLGVAPELLRAVLADSAASSAFVREDLDALFAGDYLASYGLDRIHRQLAALTSLARAHGLPHAVAAAVEGVHAEALDAFGPVDGELAAVALMERQAGVLLRAADAQR